MLDRLRFVKAFTSRFVFWQAGSGSMGFFGRSLITFEPPGVLVMFEGGREFGFGVKFVVVSPFALCGS